MKTLLSAMLVACLALGGFAANAAACDCAPCQCEKQCGCAKCEMNIE